MIKLSEWVLKVNSMLRSLRPIDSKDIFFVKTPEGFEARLQKKAEESAGGGVNITVAADSIPAKIIYGTGGVYIVELYANGIDNPPTGQGLVNVLDMWVNDTIPVNTWIMVSKSTLTFTGG